MTNPVLSRHKFLYVTGLLTRTPFLSTFLDRSLLAEPSSFIQTYDDAWARHDARALAMLHDENVIVVNRFGSLLEGRAELEKALQFLHAPGGPFHTMDFPRQQILMSHMLTDDIVMLHTKWKNPIMGPGDEVAHQGQQTQWVDLISTYLLCRKGQSWRLVQHDLHGVESIKFPFPTKWNN